MKTSLSICRKELSPGVFSYSLSIIQATEANQIISQAVSIISKSLYESLQGIKPEKFDVKSESYIVIF